MQGNLVSAVLLAALAACSSITVGDATLSEDVDESQLGAPVEVVRLRPGPYTFEYNSGFVESARLVVRSDAEWRAAWAKVYEGVSPQPGRPAIAFSREMVLVAALGQRSSGGYGIVVEGVYDGGGELRVLVRKVSPGRNCVVTAALTEPVDAVRVPRSAMPVRWVEKEEVHDCE